MRISDWSSDVCSSDLSVAYVNDRRQSNRRVIDNQGIQFMLADMASELALCEGWLWHVVRLLDSGVEDVGTEASLLKMRASDCAMRLTTDAVQLHGGYGNIKDCRVESLMRSEEHKSELQSLMSN